MGNGGAQFGAGAQEDSMSCQNLHTLEQMQDPQKVQREHFKPLKSDLKRERCGLMPFYLMHRRKTANGFFGEENVPGLSISPSSSLWPAREGWGHARSQRSKAGAFLVPDEQLSLTPN